MGIMTRHIEHILLLVIVLIVCCYAVHAQPLRGGTVVLLPKFNTQMQRSFNPFDFDYGAHYAQDFIYEPLWIYNVAQPGQDYARLAIAYEFSEDYTSIIYFLREGVLWSDGEAFDADDVVFSAEYLNKHPLLHPQLVWRQRDQGFIQSVEKIDRHTVRFNLAFAHAKADELIGAMYVLPQHIWQSIDQPMEFKNPRPVGTGPYTDLRFFSPEKKRLCRNPFYWEIDSPYIDCLSFPQVKDKQQVIKQADQAVIDWMSVAMADVEESFVAKHAHNRYWFAASGNINLHLNTALPPFDRLAFRQALSMAIDREYLLNVSTYGVGSQGRYPDGLGRIYENWQDSAALDQFKYLMQFNPEHANRMLDDLGFLDINGDGFRQYPSGERLFFRITVAKQWASLVNVVLGVTQDLQDVGINARIVAPDEAQFYRTIAAGDYDIYISGDDAGSVWGRFQGLFAKESKVNGRLLPKALTQPILSPITQRLRQYTQVTDQQQQAKILSEVQALVARDLPVISLFTNTSWYQYNDKWFKGWVSPEKDFVRPSIRLGVPERVIHLLNLSLKQPLKQPLVR